MKTGWLIVNGYLESEKFDEIYNWLIEAAEKRDCKLRKLPNDQVDSVLKISSGSTNWKQKPDFVLFWDKDVKLAKTLEAEGFKVFNSAEAIETCDDKALTFIKLKNTDIKMLSLIHISEPTRRTPISYAVFCLKKKKKLKLLKHHTS